MNRIKEVLIEVGVSKTKLAKRDSPNPRKYWSVLKTRLKKEGSELTTNCSQLKMKSADGKMYLTDIAIISTFPFDSVYSIAQSRTIQAGKR